MKKTIEDHEQDRKDYLKKYISKQSILIAILYYLCIVQYRCISLGYNPFYKHMDYRVEIRVFNPWNPISWVLFLIFIVVMILIFLWRNPIKYVFTKEAWENCFDIWELFKFE